MENKGLITTIAVLIIILIFVWLFNYQNRVVVGNAARNYQTASVYDAYQNTSPNYYYNSNPFYPVSNSYSAPNSYITIPIARATSYSYYSGPTTYYPTTYPAQYYNNGNCGVNGCNNQNCYYRQDGSYTCEYQY